MNVIERMRHGFEIAFESIYFILHCKKLLAIPAGFFATLLLLGGIFTSLGALFGVATVAGMNIILPSELSFIASVDLQFTLVFIYEALKIFVQNFFSVVLAYAVIQVLRGQQMWIDAAVAAAFAARKTILIFSLCVLFLFLGVGMVPYVASLLHLVWMVIACFVPIVIAREQKSPLESFQASVELAGRFAYELVGIVATFMAAAAAIALPVWALVYIFESLFGRGGTIISVLVFVIPLMVLFMSAKEIVSTHLYCKARDIKVISPKK